MITNCVNCGAPPRRRLPSCEYCGTLAAKSEIVFSDEYGEIVTQSARMAASAIGALGGRPVEVTPTNLTDMPLASYWHMAISQAWIAAGASILFRK